jgi:hypothetical protein
MFHRDHKRVHYKDCLEARDGLFTRHRHSATHLTEMVVAFSKHRGEQLSRMQQSGLNWYLDDKIFNLSSSISDIHDKDVIEAYFKLFDRLFFFGSLEGRCEVHFSIRQNVSAGMNGASEHNTFSFLPLGKIILLKLYKRDYQFPRRRDRLNSFLGTVLHEMIHAFHLLWGCKYRWCERKIENEGKSGHGWAWQDTAYALEMAVRDRQFLVLDIVLGRDMALADALHREKLGIPRQLLPKWGLRYEDVEKSLKVIEQQWTWFDW